MFSGIYNRYIGSC